MSEEIKKDVWVIPVRQRSNLTVVFEEALTETEALAAFKVGEYEDVLDTEVEEEEALDWAE